MERKGECNHCNWCCQFISILRVTVPESSLTPDSERLYALRNGVRGEDGKMRFCSHQFLPCTAHDKEAQRCRIYDNRPEVCQTFPGIPDQIEGTPCSFWFEGVDENGETVRRGGLGSPYPSLPRFHELRSHVQQPDDPKSQPVDPGELAVGQGLKTANGT